MLSNPSFDETVKSLSTALDTKVRVAEGDVLCFDVTLRNGRDEYYTYSISTDQLKDVISRLGVMKTREHDTALLTNQLFEFLVREETASPIYSRRELEVDDTDNGIRYRLGRPTDEYMLWLLLSTDQFAVDLWRRPYGPSLQSRQPSLFQEEEYQALTPFDALRDGTSRMLTLQMSSGKDRTAGAFEAFGYSMLFQLAFNLNAAYVPIRSLDALGRRYRIQRVRRSQSREMDPPRRSYASNLVHHYQMGVSTDVPALGFLSYYHVAESFFDDIFHDDLVSSVREMLVGPGFSYRRKTDIKQLINYVTKRLKISDERVVFNEEEALKLTLRAGTDLTRLADDLDELDNSLVDYYKTTEAAFCRGGAVNLRDEDNSKAFSDLASRIYKIRNAIVHSKEGTRPKYVPFVHDEELSQEIPLVRLLAEQLIVSASGELN